MHGTVIKLIYSSVSIYSFKNLFDSITSYIMFIFINFYICRLN